MTLLAHCLSSAVCARAPDTVSVGTRASTERNSVRRIMGAACGLLCGSARALARWAVARRTCPELREAPLKSV